MNKIELRLNNFLFNSGILGLYKILEKSDKENLTNISRNVINIDVKAFDGFEDDYIVSMLETYGDDTKWYSIISKKSEIEKLNIEDKEKTQIFNDFLKFLKTSLESASYKSGYEIAKAKGISENPYEYLNKIKDGKNLEEKRNLALKIIEYLKNNKEIYCMKDIIYTKINVFWENVAFLNRNNNKGDIKKEYKKSFVEPFKRYIDTNQKSEYNCIECGRTVSKSNTMSMSWLKDVGVDINRKKSGFWDFKEDAFICPICNLVYSCVPIGFSMIGQNGIFINDNDDMKMLIKQNSNLDLSEDIANETIERRYNKIFYNLLNRADYIGDKNFIEYEPTNIQVIKRLTKGKDNQVYEFNILSKDKLEVFDKVRNNFKNILNIYIYINGERISLYSKVLDNFLGNINQYKLLNQIMYESINNNVKINYVKDILRIQLNSIGGIEMEDTIQNMIDAGESLQKYFHVSDENENKLRSYALRISNAIRANNVEKFMELVINFYGSIEKKIPSEKGFETLMKDQNTFRLLGNAYLFGLRKYPEVKNKNEKVEGGNNDEE